MADRKKRGSSSSSRKTVRKPSAGYTLEADDTEPAEPKGRKTHKEESVGKEAQAEDGAAAKAGEAGAGAPGRAEPAEAKAEGKPESEAGAGAKSEGKVRGKAEGKSEPKSEPESEPELEPEVEAKADPGPDPDPEASEPAKPLGADAGPIGPGHGHGPGHGYAALLAPEAIEPGDPEDDAPAPGAAPPGDSRSFRRLSGGIEEFCLIYRSSHFLITRSGVVGKNGTWKVVEYPSIGSAAHAYAQECSELTGRGFRDLPRPD